MTISSKLHYCLLILMVIFVLTGCELARDSGETADMSPLEALPPTLAPLGAEDAQMASEATAVPTVLNVQATTTPSTLEVNGAAPNSIELEVPTAQPPSVPAEPAAQDSTVSEAPAAEAAPESEAAELADAPSIVVDASTPEELPEGGPIAANPPASETNPVIPAISSGGNYVVQPGDTLFGISQRYGTTVEAIAAANGLSSDLVQVGQTLAIPGDDSYAGPSQDGGYGAPGYVPGAPDGSGGLYVVTFQDTLYSISIRYGTSVEAIARANNIPYPYTIYDGQTLVIPGYDGAYPGNGYAPDQGYPQQPPVDGYYPQPGQGYPQPPVNGYYPQPGQGYPQQPPVDGYYPQPGQDYSQQPPVDGYYPQPGQGYPQQPPVDGYYPQQPPADGYYPQPGQGYPQQPPVDGYYPQPDGSYPQPGQDGGYYPQPEYGVPTGPGGAATHTVAAGETLYSIARRYGVPAEAIAGANGLANPNQLFVGQVLYLP